MPMSAQLEPFGPTLSQLNSGMCPGVAQVEVHRERVEAPADEVCGHADRQAAAEVVRPRAARQGVCRLLQRPHHLVPGAYTRSDVSST